MGQEPSPRQLGYYFEAVGVGLEMVLPAVLGMYVDRWLETGHWFTMGMGALGFAGGLFHLFTIVNRQQQDESKDKKPPP